MSLAFGVFALAIVFLLYWMGTNVAVIAKRGDPARDPEERPLTQRERSILNKRPDHDGATDAEWLAWHQKFKDDIDTKYYMPERFDRS